MLEAFCGKNNFKQYIANKLAKYDIKIYALVDSRTCYTSNKYLPDNTGPFKKVNSASSIKKRLI